MRGEQYPACCLVYSALGSQRSPGAVTAEGKVRRVDFSTGDHRLRGTTAESVAGDETKAAGEEVLLAASSL